MRSQGGINKYLGSDVVEGGGADDGEADEEDISLGI